MAPKGRPVGSKRRRVVHGQNLHSCNLCRSRRVRCDGALGQTCSNCEKRGEQCQYRSWAVNVPFRSGTEFERFDSEKVLFSSQKNTGSPISQNAPKALVRTSRSPSPAIDQRAKARRDSVLDITRISQMPRRNRMNFISESIQSYFEYSMKVVVPTFTAPGPMVEMRKQVHNVLVHYSLEEPSIRLAYAGIASLRQNLPNVVHTSLTRPIARDQWHLILNLQGQALVGLYKAVSRVLYDPHSGDIEQIFGCAWLLLAFDIHMNDDVRAAQHLSFGRRFIQRLERVPAPGSALELLYGLFLPVGGYSATNWSFSWQQYFQDRASRIPEVDSVVQTAGDFFITLEDANEALTSIIAESQTLLALILEVAEDSIAYAPPDVFRSQARRCCWVRCFSRTVALERHLVDRLERARQAYNSWHSIFKNMPDADPGLHYVLQLRFFLGKINLWTCRDTRNSVSKELNDDLKDVLSIIERFFTRDWSSMKSRLGVSAEATVRALRYGSIPVRLIRSMTDTPRSCADCHYLTQCLLTIAAKYNDRASRQKAAMLLREINPSNTSSGTGRLSDFADAIIEIEESRAFDVRTRRNSAEILEDSLVEGAVAESKLGEIVFADEFDDGRGPRIVGARFTHENVGDIELCEYVQHPTSGQWVLESTVPPRAGAVSSRGSNFDLQTDLLPPSLMRSRLTLWEWSQSLFDR